MAGLYELLRNNSLARQRAAQAAAVNSGAFSTIPPPAPEADLSAPPSSDAPTLESTEVQRTGQVPRLLEAGTNDLTSGVKNAIAATANVVGADNVAGAMRRSAQLDQERAAKITPDQIQNVGDIHDVGDAGQYVFGQAVRGLPTLGAMALGGGLARAAGAPALAGVAAPSLALNAGNAYQQANDTIDQQAAAGQISPEQAAQARAGSGKAALGAGAVGAAIDTLAFGYASKLSPFAKGELAKAVSGSLPGHIARSLAVEGASGAGRQYANDVATKMLLGNPDAFGLTPEDVSGLENAAAQNAAATSPLAVPGHFSHAIGRGVDALGAGVDKATELAGQAYQKAKPQVQQAADVAQPAAQGMMDKVSDAMSAAGEAAQPFIDKAKAAVGQQAGALAAGFRQMADAAKQPDEPGVQKSLAGALTPEAKTIRSSLLDAAPNAPRDEATLLAKRLEQLITTSPAKFEDYIRTPVVAGLLDAHFGMKPEEFSQHILEPLRALREPIEKPDQMQHAADLGMAEEAGFKPVEGIDAKDTANLSGLDNSDLFNSGFHEGDTPNDTGERHPFMTPEKFAEFMPTTAQKNAGSKAGGNVAVELTHTNTATGESTKELKQVNLINLAKNWADQREQGEKAALFGEGTQAKFDNNVKDGLSAMLNGWTSTDEHGNTIETKVQPVSGRYENKELVGSEPVDGIGEPAKHGQYNVAGLKTWLRRDSVIGSDNGKPRTFGQAEASDAATRPIDIPTAVEQYKERVAAEKDPDKRGLVQSKEAGNVARMAAEKIKDGLETLEPQRQQEVIQASIDYASDPAQRPIPKDVPSYLRMLPDEVLEHGKARLISELSDLDMNVVQPRMKGEQASSVDNPDVAQHATSEETPGRVTEDLAGQHIDYKATQEAGARDLAKPTDAAPKPDTAQNTGPDLARLKQNYAEAKTVPGKAVARRELEAATKKAKPAK